MNDESTLAEEPQRSEWLGIAVRTALALTVLVAVYVGVAYYLGGRIPNGTTVEGVQIGNLTPDDARDTLERRLEPLATEPITVQVDGEELRVDPAQAGLGLDLDATLKGTGGTSYDPRVLWSRITDNGRDLELQLTVDEAAVEEAVAEHRAAFDQEAQEGSVALKIGTVDVREPVTGRALDVPATADAVIAGWPDQREVTGVFAPVPPQLSPAEIQRFVSEEAEPALASSIVVRAGEGENETEMSVTPNQLSRLLTVTESEDHRLSLELDEQMLVEVVEGGLREAEKSPRDARVRLGDNGRPEILGASAGLVLDTEDILEKVGGAIGSDERTVTVTTKKVQPEIRDQDAEKWDVDQEMAEFRSQFPTGAANEARTENIRVGLRHVNGTVVMPGEQFSLGNTLAPITEERGYVKAGVISDGRLVEGMGGGLSQVSTTVLNTAWFAGVQLDEFTPHSYYIPRYPEGREATISIPVLDNKWTNDTSSPVIVQSYIEGDEIVMRFWGDRQYTVDTITSSRSNITEPERKTDDSEDCLPQSPQIGFDVTVTRVLSQGDAEVSRRAYTTHYKPSDEVVCTNG